MVGLRPGAVPPPSTNRTGLAVVEKVSKINSLNRSIPARVAPHAHPVHRHPPDAIREITPPTRLGVCVRQTSAAAARRGRATASAGRPGGASAQNPESTFSRIIPMNPEPAAPPTPNPESTFSRITPRTLELAAPPATPRLRPTLMVVPWNARLPPAPPEPAAKPGPTAQFKPFRTDPLNREAGAFPDLERRPSHRLREPARIREPTRRAAHAEPAPQGRDERR
jgi:hypothetical protein